ncbi:alanine racemase [Caballeronia arvi]|uniref:Alanine racemase n=1 Tax=Caballeronia arvi TaxID=1777135 RepID=A0A158L423_9BURK|nr:alanine racemase [Caballeronia arvi]
MELQTLNTPAALIDVERMTRNIERMQHRLNALGASFRPHVKTTNCNQVAQAQMDAGARSTCIIIGSGTASKRVQLLNAPKPRPDCDGGFFAPFREAHVFLQPSIKPSARAMNLRLRYRPAHTST